MAEKTSSSQGKSFSDIVDRLDAMEEDIADIINRLTILEDIIEGLQ